MAIPLLGQRLFRPPYGKLGLGQYGALSPQTTIVFWDVISGDFDTTITGEQCTKNVLNSIRNGSIIVMHDSTKALPNLRNSLKETIRSIKCRGFEFKKL
jgi:peptidoglycan/xylan/chitin deacetylase (PgdA/CDA1 family)